MWDELEFYLGEGEEAFEGQVILSFWKEGAEAPSFWFIKDGLEEEKCQTPPCSRRPSLGPRRQLGRRGSPGVGMPLVVARHCVQTKPHRMKAMRLA